ncbi:3'-5'-exoribonuclease [Trapelia coarctata]|nr:3'-5'-exoribonuclease [Trapelia coarctata]
MTDRRCINGPAGGTTPPVFAAPLTRSSPSNTTESINRSRAPTELRKIFLKTGLTPSASGSAYLELEQGPYSSSSLVSFVSQVSSLKLTCTVHGPRPLPRSAAFTPNALLSATIKFAPFATRKRRGYLRDSSERDLAVHLETALRAVIVADKWPKSGVEVLVTVLEGEEEPWWNQESNAAQTSHEGSSCLDMMSVLSGCITVASAAIADAGLDCVDLVSGGVAAIVRQSASTSTASSRNSEIQIVLDPTASDYMEILAICVVGYLRSRDEISELWMSTGNFALSQQFPDGQAGAVLLVDAAVQAAVAARHVLIEAIKESTELKLKRSRAGR